MFDWNQLNFDFNGDGILDSHAEAVDANGDGIIDALQIDFNGDGVVDAVLTDSNQDGFFETTMFDSDNDGNFEAIAFDSNGDGFGDTVLFDSNQDGIPDRFHSEADTNHDGVIDTIRDGYDYNQDGVFESVTEYHDANQDGIFDEVVKSFDSDGDGQIDTATHFMDYNQDGQPDAIFQEQFLDSNHDGVIDTYVYKADMNADHVFENVEIEPIVNQLQLPQIETADAFASGTFAEELKQFDPTQSNVDKLSGDPIHSMEAWEYQGDSQRCALYSQKFVIEELKNCDIRMEEFADVARQNGWFDEAEGTPLLNLNKMLDYYGIRNEMSYHNELSDIERCLDSGGKAIVSIDADEIWYGESNDLFTPGESANHAVEVIGIDRTVADSPMVILNDSGNPNGCGEMVPVDAFLDAWEDGNCQMIACFGS